MIVDLVRLVAINDLMYDEASHLVDTLLALNPKHEQLLKVLDELSCDCHAELVDDSSDKNFYPTFQRIVNIRNELLYGEYCPTPDLPHEFIEQIIPQALELFARLNNEFHPRHLYNKIVAGLEK